MKKSLKVIVYDMRDIFENIVIHGNSDTGADFCTNNTAIELGYGCIENGPQTGSGGGGLPGPEEYCSLNVPSECASNILWCTFTVFAR